MKGDLRKTKQAELTMDKKGFTQIYGLVTIVMAIVIAGVFLAAGAFVMDEFEQEFDAGSYAENAAVDALGAVDEIGDWLDLVVIIAIAVVIISLVVMFAGRRATGGR